MPTKDARVDAYIAEAPDFARPILKQVRKLVHQGCPEVVETIKWKFPFFDYKGLLCGMAAFKAHCSVFFWRDIEVSHLLEQTETGAGGMTQLGKISALAELPNDQVILACIHAAVKQRNSPDSKLKRVRQPAKVVVVPPDLKKALGKNKKAAETFENFAPSHRREYIDWINEAKRPETRTKRLTTTLDWLSAGKKQNWQYAERK